MAWYQPCSHCQVTIRLQASLASLQMRTTTSKDILVIIVSELFSFPSQSTSFSIKSGSRSMYCRKSVFPYLDRFYRLWALIWLFLNCRFLTVYGLRTDQCFHSDNDYKAQHIWRNSWLHHQWAAERTRDCVKSLREPSASESSLIFIAIEVPLGSDRAKSRS